MDRPLVSIIMPAYNAEKFIKEAIHSVINQTYQNWELIVIDDGSTDYTANIISDFVHLDARLKYLYQKNSKQGKARNLGIENAKGNLISFLDADDLWLPKKLEILIHEFDESKYDLIFSDAYIFTGRLSVHEIPYTQNKFQVIDTEYFGENALEEFLIYNRIPLLTTLMKKQMLIDIGMFSDLGICEDYEMWLRLLIKNYKFKSISLPLAAYRLHKDATTADDRLAIDESINILYSLSKSVSYKHQKLFSKALKLWYSRKLATISNHIGLGILVKKLIQQENKNLKVKIVSKLNFEFLFYLNKKIISSSLK